MSMLTKAKVKLILLVTATLSLNACATNEEFYYASPGNRVGVVWMSVDNIHEYCKSMGLTAPLGKFILACAKHNGQECYIYTQKNTNTHILGHELRHCFQREFHK